MTELDIWRSANVLLRRYKGEALFVASKRADALLEQGEVDGFKVWVQITKAIADLERKARQGEAVN